MTEEMLVKFGKRGRGGPRPAFALPSVDPKTPLKDLLPTPPKAKEPARRGPVEDLAHVPEIDFQAAPTKEALQGEGAAKLLAQTLARINHLNGKKTDGFLLALRGERADLDGLPFAMGDACRTKGERSRQFKVAVESVRQAFQSAPGAEVQAFDQSGQPDAGRSAADAFWQTYQQICTQQDQGASKIDRGRRDDVAAARVAALMQILTPESPDVRLGLVHYLSGVSHVDATKALAKLAIFSAEDEVRQAAVDALKVRRERDYTDILERGLHYPLPAVAKRSADAVAKLERADLIPQLVGLLEDPDPRAPVAQEEEGKKSTLVVHEVVRVNHHRNCLLCHSPGNTDGVSADTLTAGVPLPTEPLASPSNGYQTSQPQLLARIDVTYLRQDFSLFQPVEDAAPWPQMQRFDFLVRTRPVTEDEAKEYREALDKREPGRLSPYHRAALTALRDMTGKDTEPTAAAWRKLLDLPAKKG
jgi:hypothetical protein